MQIWIVPKAQHVEPHYHQVSLLQLEKENIIYQVLSPEKSVAGVTIYQDAWFSIGKFNTETATSYSLNRSGNGVYFFVLEGKVKVEGQELERRDGYGIWEVVAWRLKPIPAVGHW